MTPRDHLLEATEPAENNDHGQRYEADAERHPKRGMQYTRAEECNKNENHRSEIVERTKRDLTSQPIDWKGAGGSSNRNL